MILLAPFGVCTLLLVKKAKVRLLTIITSLLITAIITFSFCQQSWFKLVRKCDAEGRNNVDGCTADEAIRLWASLNMLASITCYLSFNIGTFWFALKHY
jgi:hypothetical protein